MDLNKLNYIIVIAEEKSFSKAAKKLFISQPALSQYVSTIENELNMKIFDRNKYPIKLTVAGEVFIKNAKELLNLKAKMIRDINSSTKVFSGTLKIGISPFRSPYILPNILSQMKKLYPDIKLFIVEKYAKELEKLLEKGDIDIAIMSLPFTSKTLSFKEFCDEETYIITPKTEYYSNLSENGEISLEKLKDEQFILPSKKIKAREKIDLLFYNNHLFPQIFLEAETQETILSFVHVGLGIGFASKMSLNHRDWKKDLNVYSIKEEKIFRKFAVVYRQDKILNEVELQLIDFIHSKFYKY